MTAPLYNTALLRLATSNPAPERLAAPMGSAERRSPTCGSRVTIDIDLDAAGRVRAIGSAVSACALGQASATLLAAHAIGRDVAALEAARDALTAWLAGEGAMPAWPDLDLLAPALPHPGRHPAIRLPFEAAAAAARAALEAR